MVLGNALILLATAGAAAAFACYLALALGRAALRDWARQFYAATTLCVVCVSGILMWMMLTDRFDVRYVHDYSSSQQALVFKVSGFWGGQEGSWLLWLTVISVVGLVLARTAGRAEGPAMAFWSSVQFFFLIILAQRSPFIPTSSPAPDGFGLNPLLQNYWMAIHPPIVFLGYTLLTVPAALAVAALARRDLPDWPRGVSGWALSGWTVLGAGLLLGGLWAYETLGWGGWWGWDPVENSSLVPWLIAGALIHGLMLERRKGAWKKMNLFLAYACFVTVIYATFLTRSGVLGDFSVHSFASLGNNNWLLGGLLAYTMLGIALVSLRTRELDSVQGYDTISSKEFLVFLGIVMFGLAAVLVALGMSSPVLSRLAVGKAGNVPVEYYYRVTTPIALAMLALIGLSPLLAWARSRREDALGNRICAVTLGAFLAVGLAVGAAVWAQADAEAGARIAVGWFALGMLAPNLVSLVDWVRRRGLALAGGHIAHVGLAVFFLGMLAATHNNKTEPDRLALTQNKAQQHLGSKWTFVGAGKVSDSGREPLRIRVEAPGGKTYVASPVLQVVRDGSEMRHPYIHKTLAGDMYIAPVQQTAVNPPPNARLAKDRTTRLGHYDVQFLGFTAMKQHEDGSVQAGARIRVRDIRNPGSKPQNLVASMKMGPSGMEFAPARMVGTGDSIVLAAMSVEDGSASVLLDGPQWTRNTAMQAVVEVTFKPLVWVLWLGAILIAFGGTLSTIRRTREARLAEQHASAQPAAQAEIAEVEIRGAAKEPSTAS